MTEINLPGRTDWESQQYRRDHGHRVAAAQAYHYLGRLIETDDSFPLPEDSEAVVTAAAAAMQAYAAARMAAIKDAAREQAATITGRSAAA